MDTVGVQFWALQGITLIKPNKTLNFYYITLMYKSQYAFWTASSFQCFRNLLRLYITFEANINKYYSLIYKQILLTLGQKTNRKTFSFTYYYVIIFRYLEHRRASVILKIAILYHSYRASLATREQGMNLHCFLYYIFSFVYFQRERSTL